MLEIDSGHLAEQLPAIIEELITGSGAVILKGAFDQSLVDDARALVHHYTASEDDKETHFLGGSEDDLDLQRRVWNLLDKGEVFEQMAQHPVVMRVVGEMLGDEFIMGSYCANRIMPGGPGQEPHIDYPYWDMYKQSSFPARINSSFPMNTQATILIDSFTAETGATAFLPHSQGELVYPTAEDRARFHANAVRMEGEPGDCVIFNGMCWHCAMPNVSTQDRTGILIEYLPKFITPLEDLVGGIREEVLDRATPMLRQLMSLDYPYPKLFDEAAAGTLIGRDSESET
ncbi:MAG: phytanoyl-CoA dioxygenase family protein [Acidimicrobiales bacterium]